MTVSTGAHSDTGTLAKFLHQEVFPDADELTIAEMVRPAGGASWETWMLTASVRRGSTEEPRRLVLKRAPDTGPLAPYEVTKDVVIFETLASSEVPIPPLLAWTTDRSVFERPFTVTDFVEGRCDDITRVERWPVWQEHRVALGHEIISTLAAIQRFDWRDTNLPSVLGPRGAQPLRVAASVDRYLTPLLDSAEERGIAQPLWRDMGAWIKSNAPDIDEDEMVIIHGDYRFGNFLWQNTEIAAVVDWERAMLGDPMADLAFICMPLSRRQHPELMGKALTYPQLVDSYEKATGRSVDVRRIQYWGVFWQFIEGVNSTRGLLQSFHSHRAVASSGFITPNLVARQTLRLMSLHDEGRDEL